jgi:hypothetical protein
MTDAATGAGTVLAFDITGDSVGALPRGSQAAGYMTGSGGVPWTNADWAEFPNAVRIDQTPVLTQIDETADVLDIETGAATNAECAQWFKAALANYKSGARPGQRLPAIYTSLSNVTPLVNTLIADGVQAGPFLWVAHWGIGQASADAVLAASGGPFPVVGVQFADGAEMGTSYDWDVFLDSWLASANGPVPPPVPPVPPAPPTPPVPPARRNVETPVTVDDVFGPLTCKAQQFVDFNGDLRACDGIFGWASRVHMQLHLGVTPDGAIGRQSVLALQARVGAPEDGLWGPVTTGHLQRALNAGTY